MLCSYERVIYPRSLSDPNPTGFMVAVYTPHEKILDRSGQALRQIKAVGYFLPTERASAMIYRGIGSAVSTATNTP